MINVFRPANIGGLILAGVFVIAADARAALDSNVVVNFGADDRTNAPLPAVVFPGAGEFYLEKGVQHSAIRFGSAPGQSIINLFGGQSHIHGRTIDPFGINNRVSQLEADAGGGLFQLLDGDAFSAHGWDVIKLDLRNSDNTSADLVIRGYDSADYNSFFDVIVDETVVGTRIDLLSLDSRFGGIYLLEYWFGGDNGPGRGNNPGINQKFQNLKFEFDNAEFAPAVPIPVAIYLFASGLIGIMALGRNHSVRA